MFFVHMVGWRTVKRMIGVYNKSGNNLFFVLIKSYRSKINLSEIGCNYMCHMLILSKVKLIVFFNIVLAYF